MPAQANDGDVAPMDVDEGADAEGEVDGRAQSVMSTRSARSRKPVRFQTIVEGLVLTWMF